MGMPRKPRKKPVITNPGNPDYGKDNRPQSGMSRIRGGSSSKPKAPTRQDYWNDYNTLKSQYDAKRGGYLIQEGRGVGRSRKKEIFYASDFTPEQGGYYAEKDGNPDRAKGIANTFSSTKPYKRPNPTERRAQQAQRRERTAQRQQTGGTILGGRKMLGMDGDDDRKRNRKTLLGS
jgi:hypothetical protein